MASSRRRSIPDEAAGGPASDFDDGYVSRSRKKREATSLQGLGEELAALSPAEIEALAIDDPLADDLRAALLDVRRMKSHEARRRHMQYVGRLMREIDASALAAAMESRRADRQARDDAFHRLERLRDALIGVGGIDGVGGQERVAEAALAEISAALGPAFGAHEREALLRLADDAAQEKATARPPRAARELFRRLKTLFQNRSE